MFFRNTDHTINAHPYYSLMLAAVALSRKGFGHTAPNPCVGALLVKDGKVQAAGWHKAYGGAHAEVEALQDAKRRGVNPAECTLLVTLEPCNHQGKTPPCTQAILDAGIRKVVIGAFDPSLNAAGGAEFLRENGVEVESGVALRECMDNIADFICWQKSNLPYLIIKMASTLDGRIATHSGSSRWISGQQARAEVHRLRSQVNAVLVGGNTFYHDNPLLNCRLEEFAELGGLGASNASGAELPTTETFKQPLAVVVTSRLPDPTANLNLVQQRPADTIFWTSAAAAASPKAKGLRAQGAKVEALDFNSAGAATGAGRSELDLGAALASLRSEHGCHYVLCEGGGKLALNLLRSNLAHELILHMAPRLFADNSAKPIFDGLEPEKVEDGLLLRFKGMQQLGEDLQVSLMNDHITYVEAATTEPAAAPEAEL